MSAVHKLTNAAHEGQVTEVNGEKNNVVEFYSVDFFFKLRKCKVVLLK